jgi:23S rRNA (cytosine1962-C5)-methyltransferase
MQEPGSPVSPATRPYSIPLMRTGARAADEVAVVSPAGVRRWQAGHPWIFRSDVVRRPDRAAGAVAVESHRGQPLGWALWSPRSEIALRHLDGPDGRAPDGEWWRERIARAALRRAGLGAVSNAFRLVHGESDGCPSLICDRYGDYLVVQLLSAGLEDSRGEIVAALREEFSPAGILARNDAPVRSKEGLPQQVELLHGDVPREVEVREGAVRYIAAPWEGQKTGAFLDQRENRELIGSLARGRALDCFSYHGSFALHLARNANHVLAVDASAAALARARVNAELNGLDNFETLGADVFQFLRSAESAGERYDTIVLDPPAFAKSRSAVAGAFRGYREINLRAMRLLAPGGLLFTASCSFHLSREMFFEMLREAAADSGRQLALRAVTGQARDHPEILTIPESSYLKGALLEAVE